MRLGAENGGWRKSRRVRTIFAPPGTLTSTLAFSVRACLRSLRPAFVSRAVKVTGRPAFRLAAPFAIVLPLARTRATQGPLADDEQRIRMPPWSADRIRRRAGGRHDAHAGAEARVEAPHPGLVDRADAQQPAVGRGLLAHGQAVVPRRGHDHHARVERAPDRAVELLVGEHAARHHVAEAEV